MFIPYYFLLTISLASFSFRHLVHAQDDQSGFISLDCGLARNSNYTEKTTLINYISDDPFITTGKSNSVAPEYDADIQEQYKTLRSFPEGIRNCYKINVTKGTRYMIRGSFFHGNYDGQKDSPPEFDLHLGANVWDTVKIVNVSISDMKEVMHIPSQDYVHVCLVNTGSGTPFISALELRPVNSQAYYNNSSPTESLAFVWRFDIGSTTDLVYRYPYDLIDRIWFPIYFNSWTQISTNQTVSPNNKKKERTPSIVISTAAIPVNASLPMEFSFRAADTSTKFYIYLHFAELQQLKAKQYRAFNVSVNAEFWFTVVPIYLVTTTIYNPNPISGSLTYNFTLAKLENSTLPPLFNAFEVYSVLDLQQSETDGKDVDAIAKIKSTYGVKKNWDGDPCAPKAYLWTGLNCSYNGYDPPRIIALNLSSSGLTGEITTSMSKLFMIQSLDLSDNNLTGSVPDFLSQLPNLRFLNLERNKLNGSIPAQLIEKSNNGLLTLRVGGNLNLCDSSTCTEKKKKNDNNNVVIPVVASVGGLVILLLVAAAVLVGLKKNKRRVPKPQKDSFASTKRQFTYAEVLKMTNNFEKVLGNGGFGTVYHGFVDNNTQVAVKILSSSSVQSYQQFQAEVEILMKVYHRNLTSLVGYCNEENNVALIYEYMANGDLGSHLSDNNTTSVLSWEGRLQVAVDAAQGLEYLHSGCKPPIVHRDVKTTNILLTENFQAKLADFGLSRSFPTEAGTHVSTVVAGTRGYIDPAYHTTGRLNEKSDVYSYGVVLLEIIANRPAIISTGTKEAEEWIHISQWVSSRLANGAIRGIVDPRLQGDFETNSVWKAVEIAMACVSASPANRPNMTVVVSELKECLAAELARKNNNRVTGSTDSDGVLSLAVTTELSPLAR